MTYLTYNKNKILLFATLIIMFVNLWTIIYLAPMISDQEWAQRIFYYHVPLAWNAFLGYFGVMIFSITYLISRNTKWDVLAQAAAEVGTIFCLLILITGPIWAKPIWGKAWTWEPRLTTTLILFLLFIGYFMIREFGGPYERSSRYAAVIGILASIDIPIIYYAVDFWSPQVQSHPQRDMGGHASAVMQVFYFSLFTFTLIFVNMMRYRSHVRKMELLKLEEENV